MKHAPEQAQICLYHGKAGPNTQDSHKASDLNNKVRAGAHPAAEDHPKGIRCQGLEPNYLGQVCAFTNTPLPDGAKGHPKKSTGPDGSQDQ